jgi:hypothetical protein
MRLAHQIDLTKEQREQLGKLSRGLELPGLVDTACFGEGVPDAKNQTTLCF